MKKRKLFFKFSFISIIFLFVFVFSTFLYISNQVPPEIADINNIELLDNNEELYLNISNNQKKTWVNLADVDPKIIEALVSIEDKKFYDHSGFDISRIFSAAFNNLISGSKDEGASTITQQYVRNIFLYNEKTWERKFLEVVYSIQIENNYTKDEIMEGYINNIYFGHGIYGISDASEYFFNKDVSTLSWAEASTLAAIPKGPTYYSPINDFENNSARKELVLKSLYDDKKINEVTYYKALDETIEIYGIDKNITYENAPYFQDKVLEELEDLNIPDLNKNLGLHVYTTLDKEVNDSITEAIDNNIPDGEIQTAIVAMEPNTGEVLSIIGGRDYESSTYNRATKSFRSPASTVKPFLYYEALEYGFNATTTFMSAPTTFYINGRDDSYTPTNFGSIYPYQDVSMAYSIATSDNIYAVKTHIFLGLDRLSDRLTSLGIESEPLASLALGATETTPEILTNAYAHFANGGYDVSPTYIRKVTNSQGEVLYENKTIKERVLEEDSTYVMNELMTGVFDNRLAININVTGSSIADSLTNQYAGKSGSTDYDNWMVGFNPQIVVGVWTGYDDNTEVIDSDERSFGKYIWRDVVEDFMEGKEDYWYNKPNNVTDKFVNPINGDPASLNYYYKSIPYINGTQPF